MEIPESAKKWIDAAMSSSEGKQVVDNLQRDENIPLPTAEFFFDRLSLSFDGGQNPISHMDSTLTMLPGCSLAGPQVTVNSSLTRFAKLARLLENPELRAAGVSFGTLKRMPKLLDKIKELSLGNARGIVWAAVQDEIDHDRSKGLAVEDVLNKLGIGDRLNEPMYRVSYSSNVVNHICSVPTVLDAGGNWRFRPSVKGAKCGKTKPLSLPGEGYSEFVHSSCRLRNPNLQAHFPKEP